MSKAYAMGHAFNSNGYRERFWQTRVGGIDPRVLGIYHGVPMLQRSTSFGAPWADTIYLIRANLERVCATRAELVERIRVTVLHETAHYVGYTEGQLWRMGLA